MEIYTCLCAAFRAGGPTHDDAAFALPCSVRLSLPGGGGMNRLCIWMRNRQNGKYCSSTLDAITGLHLDCGTAIDENIHARTKLDEANPLARGYVVSHFKIENDAARDQAGDLLEYYGTAFALNGNDVLLVLLRRIRLHGVEELAALIAHVADHARNRRAVHVHIEDTEKNADAVPRSSASGHDRYIGHFAVSWRNHCPRNRRNLALGIAEKPQKECYHQQQRNRVGPLSQPGNGAHGQQGPSTVVEAPTHHGNSG